MLHMTRRTSEINFDHFLTLYPRYILSLDASIGKEMLLMVPRSMVRDEIICQPLVDHIEDKFFLLQSRDAIFNHPVTAQIQMHGAHFWSPGTTMEFRPPKSIAATLFHVMTRMNSDVNPEDIKRISDDINHRAQFKSSSTSAQGESCGLPEMLM